MLQGIGAAEVVPDREGVQGSGAHQKGVLGRTGGGGSPLPPWLTQSKVRHGLHLTEVPRSTVDDAQVGSAAPREQHHFGSPRKGPEASAGDDTQPVVAGALGGSRETEPGEVEGMGTM